jgi:flagellar protein FlaG
MAVDRISSQSSTYFQESVQNQQAPSNREITQTSHSFSIESQSELQDISKEQLEKIINGINEFLQPSHTSLKFELHDELKEYYVQIIDERTREVIREIPPKKLLDIYVNMMKFIGLIVDKKI